MPALQQHTVWTAYLSPVTSPVGVGHLMIPDVSGRYHVIATAEARAAAGRSCVAGITLTAGSAANPSVELQTVGPCPPSVTGLGSGAAGPVRVSDAGRLERVSSPGPDDLVIGRCDADGWAYLNLPGGAPVIPPTKLVGDETGTAEIAAERVVRATAHGVDVSIVGEVKIDTNEVSTTIPLCTISEPIAVVRIDGEVSTTTPGIEFFDTWDLKALCNKVQGDPLDILKQTVISYYAESGMNAPQFEVNVGAGDIVLRLYELSGEPTTYRYSLRVQVQRPIP